MLSQLIKTITKLASSRKAVAATAGGGSAVTLGGAVSVILITLCEMPEEKAMMVGVATATILMWGTSVFVKAQGVADSGDQFYGMSEKHRNKKLLIDTHAETMAADAAILKRIIEGNSKDD